MCKKYDEFVSTREMIERIKDIISKHKKEERVYDKDVADLLGMDNMALASRIKRNSPPIVEIVLFCNRCGLRKIEEIIFKKTELLECIGS